MEILKSDTANRELFVSATLNAPIEKVWEAWTSAEHIKSWWGPQGFTNTIRRMDMKENGEWLFTMHGPDGKNYPNKIVFLEIVPRRKIVFQHYHPNYLSTVIFDPKGKETFLEWVMLFDTAELFDIVIKTFKADEGLKQNVEKLSEYLRQMSH